MPSDKILTHFNMKLEDVSIPLDDVDTKDIKNQLLERYGQDTRFRRHLARWVMFIVPLWLLAVVVIIVCSGIGWIHLDKEVLITLLATTTANILGLAFVLLKGLFGDIK